jgi:hypothetical protein
MKVKSSDVDLPLERLHRIGSGPDHVRGRRLGRPSGHFWWSLTPRYCYWRPLRQRRHQAGCTERHPRTTGCNLHDDRQLPDARAARESRYLTKTHPRCEPIQGEHLARRGCPPPGVPPSWRIKSLVWRASDNGFAAAPNFRPATRSAVIAPSFFSSRTSSLTCFGNHHSGLMAACGSCHRSARRESRLRIQSRRGRRSGSGLIRHC